jgi:hypothetical protein
MDVIMALYTDDEHRAVNQLLLQTVKVREMLGKGNVPRFLAHRDPRTNLISGDANFTSPADRNNREPEPSDELLDCI